MLHFLFTLIRWILRTLAVLVGAVALYGAAALALAWLPMAGSPPPGPAGPTTRIFVISNGFHADFVLPMSTGWADELRPAFPLVDPLVAPYVAFGWGDRDFYMSTAEVGDLQIGLSLQALFASRGSVMHVTLWGGAPMPSEDVRVLDLGPAQLETVTAGLRASFARDAAGLVQPLSQGGYGWADAFFAGTGRYTLFYTCNEWTAALLRPAGVAVPAWSPFAFGLLHGQ